MAKGLAMGLNKGHIVNKIEISSKSKVKTPRKRKSVIKKIIHEISGHAPYERKMMEMLKQSKQSAQKKAYKLAKKCLGTHRRALKKRNELQNAVAHHEH